MMESITSSSARRQSFSIAFPIVSLLSTISLSSCHVFLPPIHTKLSATSLASDPISTRRRRNAPWRKIRGGGDASHLREGAVDEVDAASEALAPVENDVAASESTASDSSSDPSTSREGDRRGGEIRTGDDDDDEMVYATTGVLNIPSARGENGVMLGYERRGDPDRQITETWGVRYAKSPKASLSNRCDAATLALAEVNGCLCHGIVLNLGRHIELFGPESTASEELDDMLLCVAEGMVRRLRGTQQITIPMSIIFEEVSEGGQVDDLDTEDAMRYVQGYLDRALYRAWELHYGRTLGTDLASEEPSINRQCQVMVSLSDSSAPDAAKKMLNTILQQNAPEEISRNNIVPRPLFGDLCKQLHREIFNSKLSSNDHWDEISAEWCNLSEESQEKIAAIEDPSLEAVDEKKVKSDVLETATQKSVSSNLRRNVLSAMAMAFVDTEESLIEMENKMDNAFLENENVCPMLEFGSDADVIVSKMSASFLALLDENEPMAQSDREWVEAQRKEALMQIVGTGIRRLFSLHLQSLRDHFGRLYELALESPSADGFDTEWQPPGKIQRQEAERTAAEGFNKAVYNSIPQICQHPDGELCNELDFADDCVEALRGLFEDMNEATLARGLEEEEWEDATGVNAEGVDDHRVDSQIISSNSRVGLRQLIKNMKAKIQKRGPAKWYERLAAKIFVIGVNYIQGWIILQTLRREATRRDLAMPKFPLF